MMHPFQIPLNSLLVETNLGYFGVIQRVQLHQVPMQAGTEQHFAYLSLTCFVVPGFEGRRLLTFGDSVIESHINH